MAENKKTFIAYAEWIDTFEALPDETAGKLAKHIWRYVNDKNPTTEDILINAVFAQIRATLRRDLKKWESEIEVKSNSGKLGNLKRWNQDLFNKVIDGQLDLQEAILIAENRKTSHCDNSQSHQIAEIAVNDNVNVIVNEEKEEKFNFRNSLIELGVEKQVVSDWLTVRRKKNATNSETAFNSIIKQINISGISANDCIKKSVENSWSGFKAEWIKNEKTKSNNDYDRKSFKLHED